MANSSKHAWQRWWPFVALCAFELLRLNLNESIPGIGATVASQGAACAVAAAVYLTLALARREKFDQPHHLTEPAVAGALLLCGPEIALFLHPRALDSLGIAISLALAPVVIAVASAGGSTAGLSLAELWPGILAAAGLALLLPEPNLSDPVTDLTMLLMPLTTGLGCALFCQWRTERHLLHSFAVFLGAAALFACGLLSNALLFHRPFSPPTLKAFSCDLVLVTLAVMSIQRLKPLQYSSRFALLPLAALIEGAILFRTWPTLRAVLGFAALLSAVVALMRNAQRAEPSEMSLR